MFNFWGAYHRTKASPVGEAVNAENAALTEEDNFNNSQSLLKSRIFCIGFFAYPLSSAALTLTPIGESL